MKPDELAVALREIAECTDTDMRPLRELLLEAAECIEQSSAKPPRKPAPRMPPTPEEVRAYCDERGGKVDAERFYDYYTSNGWYAGKVKMKDWRAAVRLWERQTHGNVSAARNGGNNATSATSGRHDSGGTGGGVGDAYGGTLL